MSAELLREAATLMRERAKAATPPVDHWQPLLEGSWGGFNAVGEGEGHPLAFVGEGEQAEADAKHIASADWLEDRAAVHEELRKHGARGLDPDGDVGAFAVARAYLGRDS